MTAILERSGALSTSTARRSVAFLTTTLSRGGTERQIVRVASGLRARGWHVVVYYLTGSDALREDLNAAGVDVESLDVNGFRQGWAALCRLARSLRRRRVDSLVTMLFHADVIGSVVAGVAGTRRLVRSVRSTETGGKIRELVWLLTRWPVDASVANSAATLQANLNARVIAAHGAAIIPNAIDLDEFAPDPDARAAARLELGLRSTDFAWVAVGAQREEKNYPGLVRSFESLRRTNCLLLIAGKPWQRELLEDVARKCGVHSRLRQLGDVKNVPRLLAAADGLVLTSRFEGMPNSVLEGMAAGLPVVTTNVGGVGDFVDNSVGRVVAEGDWPAVSAALAELASLDERSRREMGLRGRERVRRVCGMESVLDRWEALLEGRTV